MRKFFFALAFACAFASLPAAAGTVRLCTGAEGQPYHEAGKFIEKMARGDQNLKIEVIADTGGTWGNIQRTALGDGCDAMIGQPDGAALLKRQNPAAASSLTPIADLHREYLHALCGKDSGVSDIGDLENDPKKHGWTIALGEPGSGAWLIWQNFVASDKDYAAVPVTTDSDVLALAAVANGQVSCMLVPAALNNSLVSKADEQFGYGVKLVGVNDRDFDSATDPQGKPLYVYDKIPSGTYKKNLQGWWSGKSTVTWNAKVYVNSERLQDKKTLSAFISAVARARPAIVAAYGQ